MAVALKASAIIKALIVSPNLQAQTILRPKSKGKGVGEKFVVLPVLTGNPELNEIPISRVKFPKMRYRVHPRCTVVR